MLSNSFNTDANTSNLKPNKHQTTRIINHKKEDLILIENFATDFEPLAEAWYQPNMPRENVQNFLHNQEIGSFLIRLSSSCKNCYALSIRVPYFANANGIAHYLIVRNEKGYKLKGVEKEFKSLKSLVTHYSVMQGKFDNYKILCV